MRELRGECLRQQNGCEALLNTVYIPFELLNVLSFRDKKKIKKIKQPLNSNVNDYFELSLCIYLSKISFLLLQLKKKSVNLEMCFITMEINFFLRLKAQQYF